MFISVSFAVLIAGLPGYLRALPWSCQEGGESAMAGMRFENLAVCRPNGNAKMERFVQAVADAMGEAGRPPRLRFGPHGPHLYAVDGARMVSATFVRDSGSTRFDVWISIQEPRSQAALPALPEGVAWVTAHSEGDGQRLLALRLDASQREASALLAATFTALAVRPLTARETSAPLPAMSGRVAWANETGFYHLVELDPHSSYLTIYTSKDGR